MPEGHGEAKPVRDRSCYKHEGKGGDRWREKRSHHETTIRIIHQRHGSYDSFIDLRRGYILLFQQIHGTFLRYAKVTETTSSLAVR